MRIPEPRRRTEDVAAAVPRVHDRPPPPWTGVPIERDPRTGRLLAGDPSGRTDKGRSGRPRKWAASLLAVATTAMVAGGILGLLLLVRGDAPDSAAAASATPAGTSAALTTSPTLGSGEAPAPQQAPASQLLPPTAPSDLAATAVDDSSIRLTWTDQSTDETAFEISSDDGESRSAGPDEQAHVWDGLSPGTEVCYRIRAVNSAGASAWDPETASVCATTSPTTPSPTPTTTPPTTTPPTVPTPPHPPSGLTAEAVDQTSIRLDWTDESTNETGFEITDGASSHTVGPDEQTDTWEGLAPGTEVCFAVRALGDPDPSAWHPDLPPPSTVCASTDPPEPVIDLVVPPPAVLGGGGTLCEFTELPFQAQIINQGSSESGPIDVLWLVDGAGAFGTLESIHAGSVGTATLTVAEFAEGVHEVTFLADPSDTVPESHEDNNEATWTFEVAPCVG